MARIHAKGFSFHLLPEVGNKEKLALRKNRFQNAHCPPTAEGKIMSSAAIGRRNQSNTRPHLEQRKSYA